ncbi:ATP-dependent helicase [Alicyclobacillus ferrooxydans]|uniref:UvrD-like helicase C-terminal domain-containing protein n=1 Tax=Alicyclobacillus ferrooxydans TaxID=471514 RepID=A0A0P9CDK4_9BACL|nr:ATP-dependent helicase [Alicyclobacillus ferrooxydans]KPV43823.1 hypothetical protein AN477_10645 [Alicyclobacillus ferrooxydans]
MSVRFFEGPAGSGKTYSMVEELRRALQQQPLSAHERILGLSVMHGARLRLLDRLTRIPEAKSRVDCLTFDSFAWQIVKRWRSLATMALEGGSLPGELDYESTCSLAAILLSHDNVLHWATQTYPIIVVDESQDCRGGRLVILQALARRSLVFAAADHFQDLFELEHNQAVEWLRTAGATTELDTIHRTHEIALLSAAQSLRSRLGLKNGTTFRVASTFRPNDAASVAARTLAWNKWTSVAILTPTGLSSSRYVQGVLMRLTEKPIVPKRVGKPLGPFRIEWEAGARDIEATLRKCIGLPDDLNATVHIQDFRDDDGTIGYRELLGWIRYQHRLNGCEQFTVREINRQIINVCTRIRAYRSPRQSSIRAMTIHQAKNQEFDGVIVLWPYEVGPNEEMNRRLLYNAVTRARRWCQVLVQDPDRTRVQKPPFTQS